MTRTHSIPRLGPPARERRAGNAAGLRRHIMWLALLPLGAVTVLAPDVIPIQTALATALLLPSIHLALAAKRQRDEARRLAARQAKLIAAQTSLRRSVCAAPTSKALSRAVLRSLGSGSGADAGAFYLMRGGQVLELAAHCGEAWPGDLPSSVKLGEGPAGRAAARRCRIVEPIQGRNGAGTLTAVPYQMTGRVKGVMLLHHAANPGDEALELLADTTEPVAAALDSLRARERVQSLLDESRRHADAHAIQQRELQRTNTRLQRSDRYKNEFLANMTHELRSPLNSMLLLSQVLAENRHGHLAADEVDAAQVINKAGRELLVIIDDILDLTKAEAGRLEIHPEDMRVDDLAESLAALYRPLAARRHLGFSVTVEPGAPVLCHTDPTRLSQILKNLLNNALKFTERGAVDLRIRGAEPADGGDAYLEFIVADTGIGISAEVLPALFAPFTQGDGSISRRFGGSGLGLSICRKLAELLRARILVASEVGSGSTFTVRVPVTAPAAAEAPVGAPAETGAVRVLVAEPIAPEGAPARPRRPELPAGRSGSARTAPGVPAPLPQGRALGGRTILVVDGDMRAAYRLSAILEAAGARVRVARDPAGALAAVSDEPAGAPSLALVRPDVLQGLSGEGRAAWWEAVAGSRSRLVVMSTLIPASSSIPPGLPVLDPDLPAERLVATLADLLPRTVGATVSDVCALMEEVSRC